MRIPNLQNLHFTPGLQLYNPGSGGPQSHAGLLATAPRVYPTTYQVTTYALAAMPRQVIGPTAPVRINRYSDPLTVNNLEIAGLMKSPIARAV